MNVHATSLTEMGRFRKEDPSRDDCSQKEYIDRTKRKRWGGGSNNEHIYQYTHNFKLPQAYSVAT